MFFTRDNPVLNTDEFWIPIPGYETLYQVSNHGNVSNFRKILKPYVMPKGYRALKLVKNGLKKGFLVHRLVAEAFHPNPLNKPEVNHIDGDKGNNHYLNLEWVTKSENMIHAVKHELHIPKGYAAGFKKNTASSQYHNVTWDNSRQKWIAAVYHNGIDRRKRFDDEVDAALYVNTLLDEFGDTERPRNIIS